MTVEKKNKLIQYVTAQYYFLPLVVACNQHTREGQGIDVQVDLVQVNFSGFAQNTVKNSFGYTDGLNLLKILRGNKCTVRPSINNR